MEWKEIVNLPIDIVKNIVFKAYNNSIKLYVEGEFLGALQAITPAIQISNLLFDNFHNRKFMKQELKLDVVCGHIGDIFGELKDAQNAQKYYEYYHFMKTQFEHGLEPSTSINLYQFRKLTDYNLANLINHEITMSKPSVMNDIVDTLIFARFKSKIYGKGCHHTGHLPFFEHSHEDYRIASFCSDNHSTKRKAISNALMWAHYADEHRGFCVEYEFAPDDFMRNEVKDRTASRLYPITYIPIQERFDINSKALFTTKDAFMTKSGEWEYEQEVRLLQYKPAHGVIRQQYKLSSNTKINAIYFGVRCPETTICVIKELMAHSKLSFYKMQVDTSDVFNLKFEAI